MGNIDIIRNQDTTIQIDNLKNHYDDFKKLIESGQKSSGVKGFFGFNKIDSDKNTQRDIQRKGTQLFSALSTIRLSDLKEEDKQLYIEIQKFVLEIKTGLGDDIEGLAKVFEESKNKVYTETKIELINQILEQKSNTEALEYLVKVHQKIKDNKKQSKSVQKSYDEYTKVLHEQIHIKLKMGGGAEEKIAFANIITGRNAEIGNKKIKVKVDKRYHDIERARHILLGAMYGKDGILETADISPEDDLITDKNKKVSQFAQDFNTAFEPNGPGEGKEPIYKRLLEGMFGLNKSEIQELSGQKEYKNLSVSQKVIIGIVARMIDDTESIMSDGVVTTDEVLKAKDSTMSDFKDSTNDFIKKGNLGDLTDTQKNALALYKSIEGIGWGGKINRVGNWMKNNAGEFAKTGAIIAGAIALTIVAAPAVGIIAAGAAAGAGATAVMMYTSGKGYDEFSQGALDYGTSIAVGAASGALSGAVGGKLLPHIKNKLAYGGIIGTDGAIGGGLEAGRQKVVMGEDINVWYAAATGAVLSVGIAGASSKYGSKIKDKNIRDTAKKIEENRAAATSDGIPTGDYAQHGNRYKKLYEELDNAFTTDLIKRGEKISILDKEIAMEIYNFPKTATEPTNPTSPKANPDMIPTASIEAGEKAKGFFEKSGINSVGDYLRKLGDPNATKTWKNGKIAETLLKPGTSITQLIDILIGKNLPANLTNSEIIFAQRAQAFSRLVISGNYHKEVFSSETLTRLSVIGGSSFAYTYIYEGQLKGEDVGMGDFLKNALYMQYLGIIDFLIWNEGVLRGTEYVLDDITQVTPVEPNR